MPEKSSLNITNDVEFEGTLLRNGILSLRDQMKLADDYDEHIGNVSDSMFDNDQTEYSDNLAELVEANPKPAGERSDLRKLVELEVTVHDEKNCDYTAAGASLANKTCLCFYKTSTPVRMEFNSYDEIVIPPPPPAGVRVGVKVKRRVLQSTQDNLEELRVSEELLAEALMGSSVLQQGSCSPAVKSSLRRLRKTSKKGALDVLTVVLSNIV